MTEWTSISVTQSQKDTLQEHKPDDTPMGEFLLGLIGDSQEPYSTPIDSEELRGVVREELSDHASANPDIVAEQVVDLLVAEVGDGMGLETAPDELAEALNKKLGSDLEMAAYRGSKDALEDLR